MLASITGEQLSEWIAYATLEPFGEERADLRMGILAALIANVNRDPDKTPGFTPLDFMPRFDVPAEEPPSREEVAAKVEAIFSALARVDR